MSNSSKETPEEFKQLLDQLTPSRKGMELSLSNSVNSNPTLVYSTIIVKGHGVLGIYMQEEGPLTISVPKPESGESVVTVLTQIISTLQRNAIAHPSKLQVLMSREWFGIMAADLSRIPGAEMRRGYECFHLKWIGYNWEILPREVDYFGKMIIVGMPIRVVEVP